MPSSPPPEHYISLLYALQTDTSPHSPLSPPPPSDFSEHDRRLASLLDALAEICVYEDQQQVAVSIWLANGQTTLYVAQAESVPPQVIDHLTNVWKILTQIKNSLAPGPTAPDAGGAKPPRVNRTARTRELEYELLVALYDFSLGRLRHLLTSRRADIFFRDFVPTVIDSRENREQLNILVKSLRPLATLLAQRAKLSRPELEAVIVLISSLARTWRPHLDDTSPMSVLSRWDAQSCLAPQFSLRHFLHTLFFLETHSHPIRHIALARRFAPFLDGAFAVVPVPPARRDPAPPLDAPALAALLTPLLPPDADPAPLAAALADRLRRAPPAPGRTAVHPELALLAFHHAARAAAPPPRYLGVAGGACAGCGAFLAAYAALAPGAPRARAGGPPRVPWAPPLLGAHADGALAAHVGALLAGELRARLAARRGGAWAWRARDAGPAGGH